MQLRHAVAVCGGLGKRLIVSPDRDLALMINGANALEDAAQRADMAVLDTSQNTRLKVSFARTGPNDLRGCDSNPPASDRRTQAARVVCTNLF